MVVVYVLCGASMTLALMVVGLIWFISRIVEWCP